VKDIAQAIDGHSVVIVAGATGSGKTTQLPKIALAMGRGLEKLIGVTQPRRIAATSVAARVAEELGSPLGTDVGYQIRFDDRTSPQTYVKFMTDGILLAEIEGDPLLKRYDTIVVDEAHERSLTIDFLLGWLKRILPQRPDLKVIISSATIETSRFSEFFEGAPVVEVEGRTFPVDVLYEPPPDDADLVDAVADAVENVTTLDPRGDILVFLPGEREIRDCENELNYREKLGRLRHTVVQPLYARLSAGEQHKVFKTIPQRRVILATNVAETSVTIPGIVYVVDPGLARLSRYDARSGTTQLHVEGISQASADQRKGRCGRVRDGICVRLYDEQSFKSRSEFTDPEIKRTGLAGVILRMKSLGLGDVDAFPFLDPPHSRAITEGYRVLEELGAIDAQRELTPMGRRLARFPVDPRIGRMIIAGASLGVLHEVLVVAAALNVQDPRERPREKQQQADEAHRRFRDAGSDFISLLKLWDYLREAEKKGMGNLRRTCKAEFLSFLRAREWTEIQRQLEDISREMKIVNGKLAGPVDEALHRALLTGLLSKVGQWNPEARVYVGAKQTRFAIHPSSALAKKPPAWVMAFELVETTQLFARMVAKIDPHWLADAAPHLLKRSYSDPHWSEKSGRAMVKEHATLFGLVVAKDRSVDYASVAPLEARKIFVEHALVRGEYRTKGDFQQRNGEMLLELARLRDKARKSDMLADDDALFAFFDERVPESVVDGKTFEEWREQAEKKDGDLLVLSLDDVLRSQPDLDPKDYPDTVTLHGTTLPLAYSFDPSSDADGVTVTIPLALVPQLDPGELHWTIPGWHEDKIAALLYELPRAEKRDLGDLPALAKSLARELKPFQGAMLSQLAERLDISQSAFRPDAIARYLQLNLRIVDESGKELAQGRDVEGLLKQYGARARAAWQKKATEERPRTGFTTWNFGTLEPFVMRRVGDMDVRRYPAIVDKGQSVDIELLDSSSDAEEATRAGLGRLFQLGARQTLSAIVPRLPQAFARPSGAQASRAETEQFRAHLVERIVDLAFQLDAPIPRTAAEFDARLKAGAPRLSAAAKVVADAIAPVHAELNETLAALRSAGKHPSGRLALMDIQAQLEHLFPLDLMKWIPIPRLEHYPRYLRAGRARLQRAIADPRKDADKHAPFAPLWTAFLARKDRDAELRWLFEELRVAIFAPELKTPVPVSIAKVREALSSRARA
jgi:ATP-dependent helicase HrpA